LSLRTEFTACPEGEGHFSGEVDFDFPVLQNSLPTRKDIIKNVDDSDIE
jgi:hypothetical protein